VQPVRVDSGVVVGPESNEGGVKSVIAFDLFCRSQSIPFQNFRDVPMGLYFSVYCDAGYETTGCSNDQHDAL
jgi:hypothetical protein